jgi:hypothetical protein
MAIFTPAGLRIGLPTEFAFALIARLHPRVDAYQVLRTADALDIVPGAVVVAATAAAFAARLSPVLIGTVAFTAHVVAVFAVVTGTGLRPAVARAARLYSAVARSGLLFLATLALGLATVGPPGVIGFLVGRVGAGLLTYAIEFWNARRIYAATGLGLTGAEFAFLRAYQVHAMELGVSTDVVPTDEELQPGNWEPVLEDFTAKWPDVARRFTRK